MNAATTVVDLDAIAATLDDAAHSARATPQLDEALSLEDAYAVQTKNVQRRLDRGETLVGVKMGFTSRAKMVQMGVDDLIYGRLTDAMMVEDGGVASLSKYVHARVEPEVAFLLDKPLSGPVTPLQASAALAGVAPALEIIDSRYKDFKFSLTDVIADNSSSSGFVIGPWSTPGADLSNLGLIMSFNGKALEHGSTSAILGHPLRSLAAASRLAGEAGFELEAGWIILAGAATAAAPLKAGVTVTLEMETLGRASFQTED